MLSVSKARPSGRPALVKPLAVRGGRRMLTVVPIASLAAGYFFHRGEALGWWEAKLGGALSLSLDVALILALTAWAIVALHGVKRRHQAKIEELDRRVREHSEARIEAEAALRRNEERYRTIVRSLPQLVWTCTSNGSCDWLGPQWTDYTGAPESERLGDRWTEPVHPEDRERVQAAWAEASRTGGNVDFDFRLRRTDGVYRWFKTRAVPLRDASGAVVKWFGTSTDVHDLRQAETTVLENERRFQQMVEESINGIVIVDPAGEIQHANPRTGALLGYAPGELDGESIEVLVPTAARAAHMRFRTDYHRAPTPRGMTGSRELLARRKDGGVIPVEIILQPLETLHGPRIMATMFDISERVRVREALEDINRQLEHRVAARTAELAEANARAQEANRLKSEFLANMSHELRTPLNAIIGFADVLAIEKPGPLNENQKDCLNEVQVAGRHLLRLINDLLDLAKIEAGRLEPSPESFAFAVLLDEVVAGVAPLAMSRQVALTSETSLQDDEVVLDRRMTKQVLYNLLSNALKFTPEGGAVAVRARSQPDDHIAVSVSDTGIGIKSDDLGRLFQRFARLDDARAQHAPGAGLGLAISRTLTELQGGSISVQSDVGRGSTFTILLPRRLLSPSPSTPNQPSR